MNRRTAVLVSVVGLNLMACCCAGVGPEAKQERDRNTIAIWPEPIIERFGKPDVDDSTERDRPRPLQLLRWIVYEKENVRIFFHPEDDKLPVQRWELWRIQDNTTNQVITTEEALDRLKARDSLKTK